MLKNIILILVIAAIIGLAAACIYKEKKRGIQCIGCPDSKTCAGNCSNCAGCSHSQTK